MLGGFNSVKRENHHYKYAHCINLNGMKHIDPNCQNDLDKDKKWTYNMSSLTDGKLIFYKNKIESFDVELPNLITGGAHSKGMFDRTNLKSWNKDLPKLKIGSHMFCVSKNLPSFSGNLDNLEDGAAMFEQTKIKTWSTPLPKLKLAGGSYFGGMYAYTPIEEWNTELPELTEGWNMFNNSSLIHFDAQLPKLTIGNNMFNNCILDKTSISNIANSLQTFTDGSSHNLTLGIFVGYKHDPDIVSYLNDITAKGWTLTTQYNRKNTVIPKEFLENVKIPNVILDTLELDVLKLPYGYQRCLFLEDTGTQFINTEYCATNNSGIWTVQQQIGQKDGVNVGALEGSIYFYAPRWSCVSYDCYVGYSNTTNFNVKGASSNAITSVNWLNDKKGIITIGENDVYSLNLTESTFNMTVPLTMFKRNGSTDRQWYGRIYRVKISEGDQIIRDFIPALDPDGKPCMYEMIEGKPYYNAATSGDDFLYKVYEDDTVFI